jgi:hypothetical protein
MKRLLFLAVVATLTASSTGCWHWFNRGSSASTCAPAGYGANYADPYAGAPVEGQLMPGPVN